MLLLDSFTLDSFTLAGLRLDPRDVRLLSFASLAGFSSRASILVVSPARDLVVSWLSLASYRHGC